MRSRAWRKTRTSRRDLSLFTLVTEQTTVCKSVLSTFARKPEVWVAWEVLCCMFVFFVFYCTLYTESVSHLTRCCLWVEYWQTLFESRIMYEITRLVHWMYIVQFQRFKYRQFYLLTVGVCNMFAVQRIQPIIPVSLYFNKISKSKEKKKNILVATLVNY